MSSICQADSQSIIGQSNKRTKVPTNAKQHHEPRWWEHEVSSWWHEQRANEIVINLSVTRHKTERKLTVRQWHYFCLSADISGCSVKISLHTFLHFHWYLLLNTLLTLNIEHFLFKCNVATLHIYIMSGVYIPMKTMRMGDFTFWLSLSLSQFAEWNLKLNAKVCT